MTKNINYVSHKKSKVKNNGKPQLPSANSLVEGEIAINYAKDVETLSIKNESGTVVTFSSDNYYTEKKLGSGFTESNSAVTVTSAMFEIERAIANEASRATAVENALSSNKADKATTIAGYGITDAYTKSQTYTKTEVNGMVDTPHQNYVTVATYADLPATGSADTIYRVSNWDGSANSGAGAVDVTVYSEYAWDDQSNPNKYVFLCVKSQIGEVFDISVYNNNAKYDTLADALGTNGEHVPQSIRRGGMSVKYVQNSDHKYVQFRLVATVWSTNPYFWERYNDVITANQSVSDLDFSDEEGNVLVRFKDGGIKTKNFDSSEDATEEERGLMSATDKTKLNTIEAGAQVNDVITDDVGGVDLDISDEDGNILIQAKEGHIQTKNFNSRELFKEKPLAGYELFYVDVDTYYNYYEGNSTSVEDSEDIKKDLGLIQFSNLYSSKEPSRLVLWAHNTIAGLHTNSHSLTTNCDLSKALLKAGYSIFQVNGTPGEYGDDAGKHNIDPIWYRSVLAAYKYLINKYNFKKDGIFTFGYSLGGHASIQLNNYGTIPILAQVCFAGNLDIWKGSYGYYDTVAEREMLLNKFGMTENRPTLTTQNPPSAAEQQYILDNIDKWLPYNPLTSGITNIDDIKTLYSVWLSSSTFYDNSEYELYKDKRITNKPPLMLIYGENDTANPPRWGLYYYRMLKNGGGYVKLRRYTGVNHSDIFSAGVDTQTVINGETISICGSNYEAFVFLKRFDR